MQQANNPRAAGHSWTRRRKANVRPSSPFINQCSKLGPNHTRPFLGQTRPASLHREKKSFKYFNKIGRKNNI